MDRRKLVIRPESYVDRWLEVRVRMVDVSIFIDSLFVFFAIAIQKKKSETNRVNDMNDISMQILVSIWCGSIVYCQIKLCKKKGKTTKKFDKQRDAKM